MEYKLAVVDSGGYVAPDDPVVDDFADVLDVLERRCVDNTRREIGDQVVSIQGQLKKAGVFESLLTILRDVADPQTFSRLEQIVRDFPPGTIPAASRSGDCAAYFTAYHELRLGFA